jgi:hypothetical protein
VGNSKQEKAREQRLINNYKLTLEKYDKVEKFQDAKCCACMQPEPVKGRRLSVDHDWETGLFRGLLCSRCNPLLGKIERTFTRYGLKKVPGLTVGLLLERLSQYLLLTPPAARALEYWHFGYAGRVGTKAHRKRIQKEKKMTTPSASSPDRRKEKH